MSGTCPFCPPEVDRTVFAEADGFRALVNLRPILPGHGLVVPARHVERLMELEPDEAAVLARVARSISGRLMRVFRASGIDWTLQDGAEAGQTVMHLHLHLIPRWPRDFPEPGDWYPALRAVQEGGSDGRPPLGEADLEVIRRRLHSAA